MAGIGITKTLILSGAMLSCTTSANASESIRVRVPTSALMAPATLRVYIIVEPHADSRLLRVSAASEELFRSSEMPLEDDGGARVTVLYFRDLPSGSYDVTAEVIGVDGKRRGRATSSVTIL